MARKRPETADAMQDSAVESIEELDGVVLVATLPESDIDGLIAALELDIRAARAEQNHAGAGVLESLHLHVNELLHRLNGIESQLEGDILDTVQKIKSLL